MARVDGDTDRRRVALCRLMQEYIQLAQESVGAYANHVRTNWRPDGWKLQMHEETLYDVA